MSTNMLPYSATWSCNGFVCCYHRRERSRHVPLTGPLFSLCIKRLSGKSNFVANFTGVSFLCVTSKYVGSLSQVFLRSSTICPLQWRLTSNMRWSATVHLSTEPGKLSQDMTQSSKLASSTCSTPSKLHLLIKKLELIIFNQEEHRTAVEQILSYTEEEVNAKHKILLSREVSSDRIITINLQCPFVSTPVTLVDLPGKILS